MTATLRLPPEITHPKIRKAADTYREHAGEFRQLQGERYELEQTREQARERDVSSAADAHRAGKADPGQAHLDAHDAKLDETRRREVVLAEVVKRDTQDLLDAIDTHGARWREQIDQRTADARAALGATLDQLAAAHHELQAALAVGGWLARVQAGFPESAAYNPAAYTALPPNRYSNGQARSVADVVGELRALTVAPELALRAATTSSA